MGEWVKCDSPACVDHGRHPTIGLPIFVFGNLYLRDITARIVSKLFNLGCRQIAISLVGLDFLITSTGESQKDT